MAQPLIAGAAAVDITPSDSQFLYGYPFVERFSTGVHDRLLSSALFLCDGKPPVILVANDAVFLGRDIGQQRNYSNDTARQIDEEVGIIIDRCYARALDVLTRYRTHLVALAERLVVEETIERAAFDALFADVPDLHVMSSLT